MKGGTMAEELFSSLNTSQYMNMSHSWLRRSRVDGNGPPFIKLGRSVRYRKSDVDAWLDQQKQENTL
jgi:predicted DNA-binding transcriptional regulator AlpA